jgi:hypothetical protein
MDANDAGGRKSTQKLLPARETNIPIITEEDFFMILRKELRLRRGRIRRVAN